MNLIAELQAARKRQGLKQQELAERAGLSRMTVQRIESGAIDPRLSTLVEMARVLGLTLAGAHSAAASLPTAQTHGAWITLQPGHPAPHVPANAPAEAVLT